MNNITVSEYILKCKPKKNDKNLKVLVMRGQNNV